MPINDIFSTTLCIFEMRIVITGGASNGKSTIVNELAMILGFPKIDESARPLIAYLQEIEMWPLDSNAKPSTQQLMLLEKMIIQDELKKELTLPQSYVRDRTGLDSKGHSIFYGAPLPQEFEEYVKLLKIDRVYAPDPIPFAKDGIRYENPEEALAIHNLICEVYEDHGFPVTKVPKFSDNKEDSRE